MRFFDWQIIAADRLRELEQSSESSKLSNHALRAEVDRLKAELAKAQVKSRAGHGVGGGADSAEAARQELRLEHMRTDFIAAASHELKTPLAGIEALGDALDMAIADGNYEAAEEFVKHIRTETKRMRAMSEDLLDLSRFDENPDSDSVANLRATLQTALLMPTRAAKAKDLSLSLQIDPALGDGPLLAKISPTDLSIILDNLIDNALNYTLEGSINISLTRSVDGRSWLLEVSDTGIGIAESEHDKVFERFYRVESSRSRDSGGSGLGLSLVKKAVERWRGEVRLCSQLGEGAAFSLSLPVA